MKQLFTILMLAGIITGASAQSLQSVVPGSSTIGTMELSLQISGFNLNFGQASNTQVIFSSKKSGYEIYGYYFSSTSTSVSCNIDIAYLADTGLYDLIINDGVNVVTLNNAFTVYAEVPSTPTMQINPNSGNVNGTYTINITGHLTHFLGNASFYMELPGYGNGVGTQVLLITNDSTATASIDLTGVSPGIYNFYASDDADNAVLSVNQFTVLGSLPQLGNASPGTAPADTTLQVSIAGVNTNFTSASATESVWLDKNGYIIFPLSTGINSDNLFVCNFSIPANAPDGWYDIHTFDNTDGALVKKSGFYIYGGVPALGITEVKGDLLSLKLFPNPATNQVILVSDLQQEQWVSVLVTNLAGQVITSKRVLMAAGSSQYNLDVSLFASGLYIVSMNADGQQLHSQFVVAH